MRTDARAYRRDVRAKKVSRWAIPITLIGLFLLPGTVDVFQLTEFILFGLGGALTVGAITFWLNEEGDFARDHLTGALLLYTSGLAASRTGLMEFQVESMGHFAGMAGILYVVLVYTFARRYFGSETAMAMGGVLGFLVGSGALYL